MSRLIDADTLKKALVDFMDAFIDSDGDMMYSDHLLIDADYIALCDYIDKQPTVTPEPHWIPCSEKPYPDTDGIYLITARIGDSVFIEVSHFINMDGSVWWVDHDYNFGEVIAWMPAMEPYKGG